MPVNPEDVLTQWNDPNASNGWVIVQNTKAATPKIVSASGEAGDDPNARWKLHMNIDSARMADAIPIIVNELNKPDAPNFSLKFAKKTLLSKDSQAAKQVALIVPPELLTRENLPRLKTFLQNIANGLYAAGIGHDVRPINSDQKENPIKWDAPIPLEGGPVGSLSYFNYRDGQAIVMDDELCDFRGPLFRWEKQLLVRQSYFKSLPENKRHNPENAPDPLSGVRLVHPSKVVAAEIKPEVKREVKPDVPAKRETKIEGPSAIATGPQEIKPEVKRVTPSTKTEAVPPPVVTKAFAETKPSADETELRNLCDAITRHITATKPNLNPQKVIHEVLTAASKDIGGGTGAAYSVLAATFGAEIFEGSLSTTAAKSEILAKPANAPLIQKELAHYDRLLGTAVETKKTAEVLPTRESKSSSDEVELQKACDTVRTYISRYLPTLNVEEFMQQLFIRSYNDIGGGTGAAYDHLATTIGEPIFDLDSEIAKAAGTISDIVSKRENSLLIQKQIMKFTKSLAASSTAESTQVRAAAPASSVSPTATTAAPASSVSPTETKKVAPRSVSATETKTVSALSNFGLTSGFTKDKAEEELVSLEVLRREMKESKNTKIAELIGFLREDILIPHLNKGSSKDIEKIIQISKSIKKILFDSAVSDKDFRDKCSSWLKEGNKFFEALNMKTGTFRWGESADVGKLRKAIDNIEKSSSKTFIR